MIEIHNQLATSFVPAPTASEADPGATVSVLPLPTKIEAQTNPIVNTVQEVVDHDDKFLDELIVLASDFSDNHSAVSSSSHSSTTTINANNSSTIQAPANTGCAPINAEQIADLNDKKRKVSSGNATVDSKAEKALQRELAKKAKADAAKVSSLFARGEAIVFTEDAQVYADKPLAEILQLRYRGTFGVYLDANNKIFRYEFVYTALEDANSVDGTSTATAETVESSNNENHTNEEEEED